MNSYDSRDDRVRQLESLIRETAGSARRTRLLAERILHELTGRAPVAQASCLCPAHEDRVKAAQESGSTEADAESGWRLAA